MKIVVLVVPLLAILTGLFILVKWLERNDKPAGETPGDPAEAPIADGPPPYEARPGGIATDAELRFLAALEPAVAQVFGEGSRVLMQVPVGSVIQPRRGMTRGEWQKWRNRVDRKTFDFVVTDARTRVLACVELDDSSHAAEKRRERDGFLERACEASEVRLVRVEGRRRYEVEGVVGVLEAIGGQRLSREQ